MNKLKFRDGEIQLAQFIKLSSTAKQEHIQFLLTLEKSILSTNDQYILIQYGPKQITKKFLNLSDEEEKSSNLERNN